MPRSARHRWLFTQVTRPPHTNPTRKRGTPEPEVPRRPKRKGTENPRLRVGLERIQNLCSVASDRC